MAIDGRPFSKPIDRRLRDALFVYRVTSHSVTCPVTARAGPVRRPLRRGPRPAQAFSPHNRLRSRQPRNRYPEWRTGHVVEADLLAKGDRRWIAAVLAANAKLDVRPRLPPALRCDLDEFAHTIRIERNEGIGFENALSKIVAKERAESSRLKP